MKKLYTLLIALSALMSFQGLWAQADSDAYIPMLRDGRIWWYYLAKPNIYFGIKLYGDTIADDTAWQKCYVCNAYCESDPTPVALVREDDRRVILHPLQPDTSAPLTAKVAPWIFSACADDCTEVTLYDFNLAVGDEYHYGSMTPSCYCNGRTARIARVSDIETVENLSTQRRVFHTNSFGRSKGDYVEGIGISDCYFWLAPYIISSETPPVLAWVTDADEDGYPTPIYHASGDTQPWSVTTYKPMAVEGRSWWYHATFYGYADPNYSLGSEMNNEYYAITIKGDSIVDGYTYKKMYIQRPDLVLEPECIGLLRDAGRKVYYRFTPYSGRSYYTFGPDKNGPEEILLYDFTLTPGQVVENPYDGTYHFHDYDNLTLTIGDVRYRENAGHYYKTFNCTWEDDYNMASIVEGIGTTFRSTVLAPYVRLLSNGHSIVLMWVTDNNNDDIIYRGEDGGIRPWIYAQRPQTPEDYEYKPFVVDRRTWWYTASGFMPVYPDYSIDGQNPNIFGYQLYGTIDDGKYTWHKCYIKKPDMTLVGDPVAYFRETDYETTGQHIVYVKYDEEGVAFEDLPEYRMFIFSARLSAEYASDLICWDASDPALRYPQVIAESYQTNTDIDRRVFDIYGEFEGHPVQVIEGIGVFDYTNHTHLLNPFAPAVSNGIYVRLSWVTDNDIEIIFTGNGGYKPWEAKGIENVIADGADANASATIYDLTGHSLGTTDRSALAPGVYIIAEPGKAPRKEIIR